MAFPPPTLPTTRTNTTVMTDTHPAEHNAVNLAINDIVANVPRGRVTSTANVGGAATSGATETGWIVVPAFNAPGGRRYRITVDFTGVGNVPGDLFQFQVRRGATTAGASVKLGPAWHCQANNYHTSFTIVAYDIPPATATMQYLFTATRVSGTGVGQIIVAYNNTMYVDDIGL